MVPRVQWRTMANGDSHEALAGCMDPLRPLTVPLFSILSLSRYRILWKIPQVTGVPENRDQSFRIENGRVSARQDLWTFLLIVSTERWGGSQPGENEGREGEKRESCSTRVFRGEELACKREVRSGISWVVCSANDRSGNKRIRASTERRLI